MASGDATPFPIKNQAYRVTFCILDADGDLVTGATALDSEVSKDGGTFADATSEATEIATASGMYYLDLTATEMNANTVAIIIKTSTAGAKTTPIVLYPAEAGDWNQLADDLLKRDIDQVEVAAAAHSLATAILKAVSRVLVDGANLKTYQTDGATVKLTQAIATDPNNAPIDSLAVGT